MQFRPYDKSWIALLSHQTRLNDPPRTNRPSFLNWFVPEGPINNDAALENGFAPNKRQAIIWTNSEPINLSIFEALGRDELNERFC